MIKIDWNRLLQDIASAVLKVQLDAETTRKLEACIESDKESTLWQSETGLDR
jgi:hypothetical protein